MYELERDLDRPRLIASSIGGDELSGEPELDTDRPAWNQSLAFRSVSDRDIRRPIICGELDRLSSLFMFA